MTKYRQLTGFAADSKFPEAHPVVQQNSFGEDRLLPILRSAPLRGNWELLGESTPRVRMQSVVLLLELLEK
jgi:hypothetical protein